MNKPSPKILEPLWERALESEIGIAIETNDPKRLRQELLIARKLFNRAEFEEIMTFLPEGRNEVFLCRKSVELS